MKRQLVVLAVICMIPCGCDRGRKPTVAEEAAAAAGRGLDRATRERTLGALESLRVALSRYAIDHDGESPAGSSIEDLSAALVPQYLPRLQATDPWGQSFAYSSSGKSYTVSSSGPDGRAGTEDDITLADGAITGSE
jgi:hypothetical protein